MHRVTISFPWPWTAAETRELLSMVASISLSTFLGLVLVEAARPGFVTLYYSLDPFLWLAVGSGFLAALWPMLVPGSIRRTGVRRWVDGLWIVAAMVAVFVFLWLRNDGKHTNVMTTLLFIGFLLLGAMVFLGNDASDAGD